MRFENFPGDPEFPQLKIAGNPELMREVFQKHLQPLSKSAYLIKGCRLSRIRNRLSKRHVLQYTLHLVDPNTGHERSLWVTGLSYAGDRPRRIWEKFRAKGPEHEIPEGLQIYEPVSFIPDLKMLVQVFPYDRRLPTLPILMAGPPPDLESRLLAQLGPGDWRAEEWKVKPARYRSGLGAVLQYTVRAQDGARGRKIEKRFYVKIYRNDDDEGRRVYKMLHTLEEKFSDREKGFGIIKPVAYFSGLRALILEEACGNTLQEVLVQGADFKTQVRKTAHALANFNQGEVFTTKRRSREDEISHMKRAENTLLWACPHLRAEVKAIMDTIDEGLEEVQAGPTHGDFKPEHILIDGDRLSLIDLDSFAASDPVLDPAAFLARLIAMPFDFPLPAERVRTAAKLFAKEYFANVPKSWSDRFPLLYAGAALQKAAGFFRSQKPRWPEKAEAMVKEARDSLAGRIWW